MKILSIVGISLALASTCSASEQHDTEMRPQSKVTLESIKDNYYKLEHPTDEQIDASAWISKDRNVVRSELMRGKAAALLPQVQQLQLCTIINQTGKALKEVALILSVSSDDTLESAEDNYELISGMELTNGSSETIRWSDLPQKFQTMRAIFEIDTRARLDRLQVQTGGWADFTEFNLLGTELGSNLIVKSVDGKFQLESTK